MIDLTDTAAVYARARQAYENQELQAQIPGHNPDFCSYQGPCAIGVYLTQKQRDAIEPMGIENSSSIYSLIADGVVVGDDIALSQLQTAHDRWSQAFDAEWEGSDEEVADAEVGFLIQMWRY